MGGAAQILGVGGLEAGTLGSAITQAQGHLQAPHAFWVTLAPGFKCLSFPICQWEQKQCVLGSWVS